MHALNGCADMAWHQERHCKVLCANVAQAVAPCHEISLQRPGVAMLHASVQIAAPPEQTVVTLPPPAGGHPTNHCPLQVSAAAQVDDSRGQAPHMGRNCANPWSTGLCSRLQLGGNPRKAITVYTKYTADR